jgi:dihydroneopterin aldolase
MGIIKLDGMQFYAHHGFYDEEQTIGGLYTINLQFSVDFERAEYSDSLSDTVNYEKVYELVKTRFEKPCRLLEHAGGEILKALTLQFETIKDIELEIYKHNPPLGGEVKGVSVILKS